MSFKKKAAITILMMVSMLCLIFGAVACSESGVSAKEAIERYILPQNQTLVDADFTLPKTIGSAEAPITVEWKSDNTDAIAIEDGGENYTAKVTIQDEVTDVTLTISADGASKNFTVRVDGFSVYTFLDNYTFAQRKTSVKEDFDLDTETTFQGKKATISWAIDEKYNQWITLNDAKNKVIVTSGEDIKDVEIEATFSYNGETATQKYPFSVVPLLESRQIVNRYYSVPDYPLELSGYIVHLVEASEQYGNATFYMIDDEFYYGYYCYRVKIDTSDIDKYVVGAHVTVSGDTTKNYNGLWENNSGGTAVVDDKEPIDPREKVYAMDTDLLADVPSLIWHESTFVSLSGWKVASKPDTKPTGTDSNLFTLQRGDTKITVRITKYMQRTDAEVAELLDVYDAVEVGDFVDVTGILGNYNGFQIQPVVASDIKKVSAEGTNTDGAKVKAAVEAVNKAVAENFSSLISTAKEVTMPTSVEGVSISYRVAGAKNPTVAIDGGKFNINPINEEKNYDIEVTYKIGDYEAYGFFKLQNWKLSDQELVATVKAALEQQEISEIKRTGEFDLPAVDDLGTTITWKVKDASLGWITVEGGKIKVTSLPAADTEVTLVATIALNSDTATVELKVKVTAAEAVAFKAIDAPAAGDYIFALYQGNLEKWLYSTGAINSSSFGATTESAAEAATFTLAASGEGWTIQLKSDSKYLELNDNHRMCYVDAPTQPWKWNTEYKVFTFDVTEDGAAVTYYIGTYNTFDTFSASKLSYLSGGGNFAAHFGTMAEAGTNAGEVKFDFSSVDESNTTALTAEEVLEVLNNSCDGSSALVSAEPTYIYKGAGSGGGRPDEAGLVKFGKSKTAGKLVLTFSKAVTSVVINCHAFYKKSDAYPTTSDTISVNGSAQTLPYNETVTGGDLTFTLAASASVITIETSERAYVFSLKVTFDENGGTVEPTPTHTHNYTYTHTAGAWTHTGTCSAEGCDQPTITENCTPELNVCKKCGNTYTPAEIVAALYELENGKSLPGTYTLTGVVKSIDDPYSDQYKNVTFTITVEEKDVVVFRAKGDEAANVKVGDTVTVQGSLMSYQNDGKKEFNSGCTITSRVAGSAEPEPEPQPEPEGALNLTSESLTVLDPDANSGYDKYKGTHTVGTYQVTTADVMVNTNYNGYSVLQFKKESGTMTLSGNFTKITLTIVSTYDYSDEGIISITAGETALTAKLVKTEDTGKMSGDYKVMMYTVEFTVTGEGVQTFTLKGSAKGAVYLTSIVFSEPEAATAATAAPEAILGKQD